MEQKQVLPDQYRILEKLLAFFVRSIQERVNADGALVILKDDAAGECYIPAAVFEDHPTGQRFKSIRFPMGKGVSGQAMQSGEPLLVSDYPSSPWAWPQVDEITDYHTRNMLAVPMRTGKRVVGVLCAVNKKGKADFDQQDLDLLENMAGIAVLPIENAAIHADLEAALQRVHALNQANDQAIVHLSHMLKTPLAVLSANLKLLKKMSGRQLPAESPYQGKWEKVYDRVRRNLERLTYMEYEIEDILRRRDDPSAGKLTRMLSPFGESPPGATKGSLPLDPDETEDNAEHFFREVNIEFLIHELKGPLSVIDTNIQLLIDRPDHLHPLSRRQTGFLNRIGRGTDRARSMLGQLLEVGRAEAQSFHCQAFDPESVLREVILEAIESNAADLYERIRSIGQMADRFDYLSRYGIRLEVSSSARRAWMYHDEIKFRQITGNLLKNALDYRRHTLLVYMTVQHQQIVISIRDDGPGIAPEHHEKIFQRYKQINPQPGLARNGHGLGLAVSRILARAMGGDIMLESQLGQGALFKFNLALSFTPDGDSNG